MTTTLSSIKPMPGWAMIAPAPSASISKGGIIIADTVAKQKTSQGTVIDIAAPKGDSSDVQVGDTVLYNKNVAKSITIESSEIILVRCEDIQAILHPKTN